MSKELKLKQKKSELNHPGNTPMRARIEVEHTMCTKCEKIYKFCQYCLNIHKEVAPLSKEVKDKNKKKSKLKKFFQPRSLTKIIKGSQKLKFRIILPLTTTLKLKT